MQQTGFIVQLVFHSLNLLFILHNIYRYIIGLRMKQTLIWMFYILILVCTVLRIVQVGLLMVNLQNDF